MPSFKTDAVERAASAPTVSRRDRGRRARAGAFDLEEIAGEASGSPCPRARGLRVAALTVMLATLSLVFGALAGLDPVPLAVLSVTYLLMRASRPSFWEVRPLATVRVVAADPIDHVLALPEA